MSKVSGHNISIVAMDETQTIKDEGSDLYHVWLSLSEAPTSRWVQDFNTSWSDHFYMMKRHALVSGDGLVVRCLLDELGTGLKEELEKVIAQVNKRQRAAAEKEKEDQLKAEVAEREEKQKIADAAKLFNSKQ